MCYKICKKREITNTWKQATITPLLKNRKDPKDVRSYRPEALTNVLCKIFEKMINERLVWDLEKEKRIAKRQLSFRKQRSTIDAISKIITKFLDGFQRKEKTAAIFFNIEKEYDKVNREKTLEQLEDMGIHGT